MTRSRQHLTTIVALLAVAAGAGSIACHPPGSGAPAEIGSSDPEPGMKAASNSSRTAPSNLIHCRMSPLARN